MRDLHVGALVIVEEPAARPRPVGILTDRDIVVQVLAKAPETLPGLAVKDVMSSELVLVHETDSVEEAINRMRGRGVRRLPVVDDQGALIGILALDDVLETFAEEIRDLTHVPGREQRREREQRP